MDELINVQENKDNFSEGLRDGKNKRLELSEPLDSANGTENVEGDLAVSKLGQFARMPNANQEIPLLTVRENGRGGRSEAGPVKFEFHFPEEVWLLILNMVEDGDRVNCCRAFPYLDRILTASKPMFLFEQVLSLILMEKLLNQNELLNCRQVCKKWCVAVDQLMYTLSSSKITYLSEYWKSFYKFGNQKEVDGFIKTFAGHSRNPYFDGTVYIENINSYWDREYPEKVLQLFRQFGKHIRILRIGDFCEALGPFAWYRFLQEALKSTPNLRQLGIIGKELNEEEEEEDASDLYSYMIRNPLPFIPTLDVLCSDLKDRGSGTVQDIQNMLMLSYAGQLKTLSMFMANWKDHYATGLVNLSKFILFDLNSDTNLSRLLRLTAPLKLLTLFVTSSLKVPVLLRVLKNFPSLEGVTIKFCGANQSINKLQNGEDISNLSDLNVPAVKSLILDSGTLYYNFLQMFTSLHRLTVRIESSLDIKEGASKEGKNDLQIFKIAQDEKIYDSNIWKLIPTLKYAEIQRLCQTKFGYWHTYSGTRKGYDEYMSKQEPKSCCRIS